MSFIDMRHIAVDASPEDFSFGIDGTFNPNEGINLAVCNSDDYDDGVLIGLHAPGESIVALVTTTQLRELGRAAIDMANFQDAAIARDREELERTEQRLGV